MVITRSQHQKQQQHSSAINNDNLVLSYKQIEEFILKGKQGDSKYNSIEQPFMVAKPVKDGEVQFYTAEVNSILEKIPIHETLKRIYQVIGNPDIEYYFGPWTLFSLNKVQEHYNILLEKNQNRAIDFSIIYAGLGHCIIVSYDPELNKIYYRAGGGSDGWIGAHVTGAGACDHDDDVSEHAVEPGGGADIDGPGDGSDGWTGARGTGFAVPVSGAGAGDHDDQDDDDAQVAEFKVVRRRGRRGGHKHRR
jgi:hypothetical protein